MTELICIVCPKGCHINVDENNNYEVIGNGCDRGEVYGKKELINPTRVIPTTVRITGAQHRRLPVKTDKDISKSIIFDAVRLLDNIEVVSPIKIGDIVYKDILGTGVNFVATRNM